MKRIFTKIFRLYFILLLVQTATTITDFSTALDEMTVLLQQHSFSTPTNNFTKTTSCSRSEKRQCVGTCQAEHTQQCKNNSCKRNRKLTCKPFIWQKNPQPVTIPTTTEGWNMDRGDSVNFTTKLPTTILTQKPSRNKNIQNMFAINYELENHYTVTECLTRLKDPAKPLLNFLMRPCFNSIIHPFFNEGGETDLSIEAGRLLIIYKLIMHCDMPLTKQRQRFALCMTNILTENIVRTNNGIVLTHQLKNNIRRRIIVSQRKEDRTFAKILGIIIRKMVAKSVWEKNMLASQNPSFNLTIEDKELITKFDEINTSQNNTIASYMESMFLKPRLLTRRRQMDLENP